MDLLESSLWELGRAEQVAALGRTRTGESLLEAAACKTIAAAVVGLRSSRSAATMVRSLEALVLVTESPRRCLFAAEAGAAKALEEALRRHEGSAGPLAATIAERLRACPFQKNDPPKKFDVYRISQENRDLLRDLFQSTHRTRKKLPPALLSGGGGGAAKKGKKSRFFLKEKGGKSIQEEGTKKLEFSTADFHGPYDDVDAELFASAHLLAAGDERPEVVSILERLFAPQGHTTRSKVEGEQKKATCDACELLEVFRAVDTKGQGLVDARLFRALMKCASSDLLSEKDLDTLTRHYANGDNSIDYDFFCASGKISRAFFFHGRKGTAGGLPTLPWIQGQQRQALKKKKNIKDEHRGVLSWENHLRRVREARSGAFAFLVRTGLRAIRCTGRTPPSKNSASEAL